MTWRPALLFVLALLVTPATAQPSQESQQRLLVNGLEVEGVRSDLLPDTVPATAYAPAQAFAEALGADFSYDIARQVATFEMASRLVTLNVTADPVKAAEADQALALNGSPRSSMGGFSMQNLTYVPVKSVAEAFGGRVDYLASHRSIIVVLPRSVLEDVQTGGDELGYDRIVLTFDAPAPIHAHDNLAQNSVAFSFERTEFEGARSFAGDYLRGARLVSTAEGALLTLELEPGSRYDDYTVPNPGGGFSFVVDVFPAPAATPRPEIPRIVLDPGHGGVDTGLIFPEYGTESQLTLEFARRLATLLDERGFDVQLTRDGDSAIPIERRSSLGAGADIYLSIHAAPMALDQLHLYYLGEASGIDSLTMAMRENAESAVNSSATDALRRRILLDLVTNLELGELYAQRLAGGLEGLAGYSVETAPAPVYVLGGAAGRGLLLELSPQSVATQNLPGTLAELISDLVGGAEQ